MSRDKSAMPVNQSLPCGLFPLLLGDDGGLDLGSRAVNGQLPDKSPQSVWKGSIPKTKKSD